MFDAVLNSHTLRCYINPVNSVIHKKNTPDTNRTGKCYDVFFTAGAATLTLTSTLDGRQTACPGEVVTYTCTVLRTAVISWVDLPGIGRVDYYPRDLIGQRVIGDFQIALISNVPISVGLADLTITLTVTATPAHNGTEVECRGDDPSERMSLVLYIASEQSVQLMVIIMYLKIRAKMDISCRYAIIMLLFVLSFFRPAANHQGHCFFLRRLVRNADLWQHFKLCCALITFKCICEFIIIIIIHNYCQ